MLRAVRDTLIMSPPLVITPAEIDQLVATLEKSLTEAAALLG
jgi:putrescine aminotransferase